MYVPQNKNIAKIYILCYTYSNKIFFRRVKMLLVIDIGNTNITIGIFENDKLKITSRSSTNISITEDQYITELKDILRSNNIEHKNISDVIISSVVPETTSLITTSVKKLFKTNPIIINKNINTGLKFNHIDHPETIGADLIVGATAAMGIFPNENCLILDLGTSITLFVVTKTNEFLGGCIMPGVCTSLHALTHHTALLPNISLDESNNVIGTNTMDCMRSGFIYGFAAMIDGMCQKIIDELQEPAHIIATGGEAKFIVPYCAKKIILNENLLLEGLNIIYKKQNTKERTA